MNKFFKLVAGIYDYLAHFFTGDQFHKAQEIAHQVTDLVSMALPIVQIVAELTPTPVDDLVLAGLAAINKTAKEILEEPDHLKQAGMLVGLCSAALREKLLRTVEASKEGVKIGDKVLKTATDVLGIADSILNAPVQDAYTLWHNATKK